LEFGVAEIEAMETLGDAPGFALSFSGLMTSALDADR
jgi:hypothetical protein